MNLTRFALLTLALFLAGATSVAQAKAERLGYLDELPPLTEYLPEAPAPDEPDLDRLKDVRRRLAAGEDLPSLGGRTAAQTNTGARADRPEDEDVLPPPAAATGDRSDGPGIDELTDRLELAARNAVGRLRAAVAASHRDEATEEHDTDTVDAAAGEDDAGTVGGDEQDGDTRG